MMLSSGSFIEDSIIWVLLKVLTFKTKASFSLFGHSERHQGLKIKTSGLKKSYLKTAAVLRPSLTNYFAVSS
jgi:hypothetical protein